MTQVKVVEKVAAPADDVFQRLCDFGGIKVGGPVESFEIKGDGVGSVRTIGLGGGYIIERLDRHDSAERVMTYAITNEDPAIPVSNYSATVTITDDRDGTCTVDWTGNFEPKGAPEQAVIDVVKGIYTGGIQRTRDALGV